MENFNRLNDLYFKKLLGDKKRKNLTLSFLNGVLNKDDKIGKLKEGYEADIIMFDLNKPHFYPLENSHIANIVYSGKSSDIVLTMVQGKILMENRKLLTIDLNDIFKEISNIVKRIYS